MTPKQRVMKRWPYAAAIQPKKARGWCVVANPFPFSELTIGTGPTPAAAWRDAAGRMK